MVKRFRSVGGVLICLGAFQGSTAWAGVGLELLGAGTYSVATGTPTPTPSTGYGGGAILDFRLGPRSAFQLGAIYETSVYSNPDLETNTIYHLLAGFKFMLGRVASLNLGGFYNSYATNPQGLSGTDEGLYAGLAFHFPMSTYMSFVINPTYNYALNTLSAGSTTITPHQAMCFVGFAFGMAAR